MKPIAVGTLYEICGKYGIAYWQWIVAQTSEQAQSLEEIPQHAKDLGVPTWFVSMNELRREEPDVQAKEAVLESSSCRKSTTVELACDFSGYLED